VPEKHWMYRLAKRHWFNDFGAYGASAKQPGPAGRAAPPLPTAPLGEDRLR